MSDGRYTLGIYLAIGITGAAFGQVKVTTTVEKNPPSLVVREAATSIHYPSKTDGWTPPDQRYVPPIGGIPPTSPADVLPKYSQPIKPPRETIVIDYGRGGRLDEHNLKFAAYKREKAKVRLTGPCLSACTLVMAYVAKEDICFASGSYLAFHQARSGETGHAMPMATEQMYRQQPAEIRTWIDDHGGWQNLPFDGFWTMYARDLWAMGYPRCQ